MRIWVVIGGECENEEITRIMWRAKGVRMYSLEGNNHILMCEPSPIDAGKRKGIFLW